MNNFVIDRNLHFPDWMRAIQTRIEADLEKEIANA